MGDLYPTPNRLALLDEVEGRAVHQHADGTSTDFGFRKVTAAIADLEQAGWVQLDDGEVLRPWVLTDAGQAVLDQHRRSEDGSG